MKRVIGVIVLGLFVSVPALFAEPSSEKPGQKQKYGNQKGAHRSERDRDHVVAEIRFSIGEVRLLRDYYAPRYRSLPPGLQKKLQRGGELPPGWRKKLEPIDPSVDRQLGALPSGYRRGVIDGHAVVYNPRTRVIVDLAVLF